MNRGVPAIFPAQSMVEGAAGFDVTLAGAGANLNRFCSLGATLPTRCRMFHAPAAIDAHHAHDASRPAIPRSRQ
jgi:hypothetical protein